MEPIIFTQYEKISDDLYFLGKYVVLRFNVGLAYYKDGKRNFFHREYEYEKERENVVSIKRTYDYYLSLENINPARKEFIMITPKEFPRFREAIHTAADWFRDKKYSKLFVSSKGKLVVTSPIPVCEINSFPQGKYIKIEPVVITVGAANADNIPGVCITLSDPNNYIYLNVDTLIGLEYTVDCVNMIQMAQSMLASLPSEPINRTSIGITTTRTSFEEQRAKIIDQKNNIDNPTNKSNIQGRFIGQKRRLEDL